MKRLFKSRWFKIPYYTVLYAFAAFGCFLTVSFAAIQFGWTNDKGAVDSNNRQFELIHANRERYESADNDSTRARVNRLEALDRILLLHEFYPTNADYILTALENGTDEREVLLMLDAMDLQLQSNDPYQEKVRARRSARQSSRSGGAMESAYEWMNINEWRDFKIAVAKDQKLIDSVEQMTDVEGRLVVSCLVAEQIRLFNSDREAYKKWIGPLKVLSVESKFSFGVTGIKEHTAKAIERNLKDPACEFYLGAEYEHLLDFAGTDTATINKERITRLTNFRNHYYSYLYAALFIKQVKMQWERSGHPVADRPEILATLFNLGYIHSKPKANPQVGGAEILIYGKSYTFGAIAFQFYYSGELFDIFPYRKQKFDWDREAI